MKNTAYISKTFIVSALMVSFFTIFYIFQNYMAAIVVGFILTLATSPIYGRVNSSLSFRHKDLFTAFVFTSVLFLFVFLPFVYFIGSSYKFIPNIDIEQSVKYLQGAVAFLKNLPEPLNIFQESVNALLNQFDIFTVDMEIVKAILNKIARFFWEVNGIIYQFFLILFFYFLFNFYGQKLFTGITRLLPMAKAIKRTLYKELGNTISSVFFGTIFSMFMQGLAFGVFVYLTTDYDAVYLGMAAGFVTAIPIVGTYLVAVPLALMEVLNQNFMFAFMIILFSLVVMSGFIDNVLRLFFMRYINQKFSLHYSLSEFFILLAMIAGIGVFGGWGIILAPALLSLCMIFIEIYGKKAVKKV